MKALPENTIDGMGRRLPGMRILVVGGNGFIGRHVVRQLHSAGTRVTIMDVGHAPDAWPGLDQVIGSVQDTGLVASAVTGCDMVIFLANSSLPASANVDLAAEVDAHVKSTVKVAEICYSLKVKRFVFASSGGTVYGYSSDEPLHEDMPTRPRNAYGASKLAIEHYLRILRMRGGMETISLRISNPYGEGQRAVRNQGFIAAAIEHALTGNPLPIWGDGSIQRDFVHVSDVARAFLAACEIDNPPEVVNIGSGKAVSLRQILAILEELLERKIACEYHPGRSIDVSRNFLNIRLAQKRLGWKPFIDLRNGLLRTVEWWREKQQQVREP